MNSKEQLLINILEEITRRYEVLFEENKKLLEEISFKANHDTLTKLYNREYFHKQILHLIEKNKNFCLVFMDLDNFKKANDTYGHKVGDMILIKVANILRESLKGKDVISRFGGDEFVIAIVDCDKEKAFHIMKEISDKIKETLKKYHITTSIGIACFPKEASDFEELLRIADMKMYEAKTTKDNIVI